MNVPEGGGGEHKNAIFSPLSLYTVCDYGHMDVCDHIGYVPARGWARGGG